MHGTNTTGLHRCKTYISAICFDHTFHSHGNRTTNATIHFICLDTYCCILWFSWTQTLQGHHCHYNDAIMSAVASQITSLMIAYSTVDSDADQRKHQSSASLAFVQGIHRGHKWPVMQKMFWSDDVILVYIWCPCIYSNRPSTGTLLITTLDMKLWCFFRYYRLRIYFQNISLKIANGIIQNITTPQGLRNSTKSRRMHALWVFTLIILRQ